MTKDEIEKLRQENPRLYAHCVAREEIMPVHDQERLSRMRADELHDFIMQRNTSNKLCLDASFASNATRALEEEILSRVKNLQEVELGDLPRLRQELQEAGRPGLTELKCIGDPMYTQEPRKPGDCMQTGKLEYKVTRAEPVLGPRFFATFVGGYHGFLKYFIEEVRHLAPRKANAYLLGAGWWFELHRRDDLSREWPSKKQGIWSPIVYGNQLTTGSRTYKKYAMVHVVPIQFFQVEYDASVKYMEKWTSREMGGGTTRITIRAVPRPARKAKS